MGGLSNMQLFEKQICKLFLSVSVIAAVSVGASAQQQSGAFLNGAVTDQGLKLNFSSTGTYSDNILRFSDIDIAERTDLEAEDYVLDLAGNIAFGRRIGRNQLSFDSSVGYRFHDNNNQLDSERFSGRGLFNWRLGSRCGGVFGGQWLRDNGQFETVSDVLTSNTQTTLNGGAQVQCNVLGPLQVAGVAVFSTVDNTDATREINDRDDQFYSGSLRYTFGRGSYVGALVSSSISDFDNRSLIEGAVDRFELVQYAGEANLVFGRSIQLNAQVGYTDIKNSMQDIDTDLNGLSGAVSLQLPIGGSHTVNLTGSRAVTPLQSVTAIFARTSDVVFTVNSSWSPRLSSQINAAYTRRRLESDEALEDFNEGFNDRDTTYSAGVRINYDLGRLIGLNLSYRYDKRNARVDSFEFSSNTVMLGLRVKFR